ncbi:hypothetical protein EBR96_03300 [bacterium]|nr:hypothetical protein [bacterium]
MIGLALILVPIVVAWAVCGNRTALRRMGWMALGLGFIGWLSVLGQVLLGRTLEWIVQFTPILALGLSFNGLTTVMATMIFGLGAVVMRYSDTYLDGDPHRARFMMQIAVAVSSAQFVATSATLPGMWGAWIVTSWMLHKLLKFGDPGPALLAGIRAKWYIARAGDGVLALAFTLMATQAGSSHVSAILSTAFPTWIVVLMVLGFVIRAAVFPLWTWLFYSVEAPTPVSALLHAGILNAGPFLLMRLFPVIAPHGGVLGLCVGVGAITAIGASIVSMTQPSIKGMLAYSSAAHMGFMIFMIGIGGVGPAFVHLIGHSIYKAHAFLGSGNIIQRWRRFPSNGNRSGNSGLQLSVIGVAVGVSIWSIGIALSVKSISQWGLLSVLGMGLWTFLSIGLSAKPSRQLAGQLALGLVAIVAMFSALESVGSAVVMHQFGALKSVSAPPLIVWGALGSMAFTTLVVLRGWRPNSNTWNWLRNGMGVNPIVDQLTGRYHN